MLRPATDVAHSFSPRSFPFDLPDKNACHGPQISQNISPLSRLRFLCAHNGVMDGNADNPRTPSPSPKRDRVLPSVEFTFSCSPSSAGGAITPTSSVDQSSPRLRGSDRRSITPTAQSLFKTLRLSEHVKPQEAEESSVDYTEQAQRVFGLSPTPKSLATTYRDLHNATPSPAGPSSRRPDQQSRASTPASPLEDVKSNLTNLNLEGSKHTAANASDKIHHELVFTDHVAVDSDDNATHDDSEHGHSDDDDDEDDDDDTSRYNVRQEELPRAPIYDIQLQNALRNIRGQLAGLAQQLGRRRELVSDSTTMLHQLYDQALKASRFAYPATRTVGFIGDSGMGEFRTHPPSDRKGLSRIRQEQLNKLHS